MTSSSGKDLQFSNRDPVIEQAVEQFIKTRRTKNTQLAYAKDFGHWLEFAYSHGVRIREPTLPEAAAWREHMDTKEKATPASIYRRLSSTSVIYRVLIANGLATKNPFDQDVLPRPQVSKEGVTPMVSEEDAQAILEHARADQTPTGARDYALLRLLYDTGLRRASVAGILVDEVIKDKTGKPHAIKATVKGGRIVEVALPEASREALNIHLQHLEEDAVYVFHSARNHAKALALGIVNRIVQERAKAAGCAHVSPHQFRVAFITTAYDLKINEREIQGAAHHAAAETTRRYDRKARGGEVADAIAKHRGSKKP